MTTEPGQGEAGAAGGETRPTRAARLTATRGTPLFWGTMCALVVGVVLVLRLVVFYDRFVAVAHGLPLLICLWHRDRRWLYGMAGVLTAATLVKSWMVWPQFAAQQDTWYLAMSAGLELASIWVMAEGVHWWIRGQGIIWTQARMLAEANRELQASNAELAAHELEITRQNEALQSQAKELAQRTAAQELTTRGLEEANDELRRREHAMALLVDATRWLGQDADDREVLTHICQAGRTALGESRAAVVAVVERRGDRLAVRACAGLGEEALPDRVYERSFAAVVVEEKRTAYLRDAALRPDLGMPQPGDGRVFRSALASPLQVKGEVVGALAVYGMEPRDWLEADFRVIEWLASQASLLLEAAALQQELMTRRVDAEEASRRKTHFLAAVSHDVRTPVNAINLLAELMIRTASDPHAAAWHGSGEGAGAELRRLARELRDNAKGLTELVSDVLDVARFDSGRADLQVVEFGLLDMLRREVAQYRPLAETAGLTLALLHDGEEEGDVWLRSDRLKLARVVGNLLGNAIKFTERGGVSVEVNRMAGGGVMLRVRDTGVGIAAEHLTHIFDEFYQLRNVERDRSKGTGLGLAICKRLTATLGCTLTVESFVGEGSTFTIGIPPTLLASPAESKEGAGEAERSVAQGGAGLRHAAGVLAGVRILLVEDHDTTRKTLSRLLRAEGATVLEAPTAREGIQALRAEPEVVLLDMMLPDLDGREVLRVLGKGRPAGLRRVLVVSGDVTPARVAEVRELGADGMISKPVDLERLVGVIRAGVGEGVGAMELRRCGERGELKVEQSQQ